MGGPRLTGLAGYLPAMPIWPHDDWQTSDPAPGTDADGIGRLLDRAFAQPPELGLTLAVVAVQGGTVVAERYADDAGPDSTFISWSMAKSMTQALVGMLVGDGRLDIDAPADVPEWQHDGRARITVRALLDMCSGLEFCEDYVDAGSSHVIEMLFGAGMADHATYAASFPLVAEPGTVWNYSSGTTNIVARIAGRAIGTGREDTERYLRDRLVGPLGMRSTTPKFDDAGTFVGSSYVYATARDFARFGYLYLHDGVWDGTRLLPDGWVDAARTPVGPAVGPDERHGYGAHWWLWRHDPTVLAACGYEAQRIIVDPARDLVLVRLGKSPAELGPAVDEWLDEVRNRFPTAAAR